MPIRKNPYLICLGLVGAGISLAMYSNQRCWNRRTLQLVDEISLSLPAQEMKVVSFQNFDQLPEPVAKYLRFALREGQPLIRSVRLEQLGELRGGERPQDRWMSFQANQFSSALRPGFMWEARIRAFPLMQMQVREAYVGGQGAAQVTALSLVTLADEQGSAELAEGELLRYLAESVWYPTALLPSEHLTWSPIDRNTALAKLTDSGTSVSLEFQFNDIGEVISVYTPSRYRAIEGRYEPTPWGGQLRAYEEKSGMWIPTEGEVQWHLPTGTISVWKGRVVEAEYDYLA